MEEFTEVMSTGTRQRIYIDDGGAGNHTMEPSVLVQDHLSFTAVFVPAASVTALHEGWRTWIEEARHDAPEVQELHTTALINPKRGQPWKVVRNPADRARHLLRAADLLLPHAELVVHAHIGKEQYFELLRDHADEIAALPHHVRQDLRNHKNGLELVLSTAIGRILLKTGDKSVVLIDGGRYRIKNADESPVKFLFGKSVPVWRGAMVYQPSQGWPGIQLADMASVAIARQYVTENRVQGGGRTTPLDDACKIIRTMIDEKFVFAFDPALDL